MKKCAFAFLLDIYLIQIAVYLTFKYMEKPLFTGGFKESTLPFLLIMLLIIVAIGLAAVNIIRAILSMNAMSEDTSKQRSVNCFTLIFKLSALPFFIVNFAVWLVLTGAFIAVPGLQIFLVAVPIGAGFAYLVLLVSSSYSIASIITLYRQKVLTRKQEVIHIILQLMFVADAIDYIFLHYKINKRCKSRENLNEAQGNG